MAGLSSTSRSRRREVLRCASVGLVLGVVVALLALVMTGAGHGWGSGVVTIWAVLLFPAAGIAWALRDKSAAVVAAFLIVLAMLVVDLALVYATKREGVDQITRVWEAHPALMAAWACAWFGAHLVPMWTIVVAVLASSLGRGRASIL